MTTDCGRSKHLNHFELDSTYSGLKITVLNAPASIVPNQRYVRMYIVVALLLIPRKLANLYLHLHEYLYSRNSKTETVPISPVRIGRPRRAKAGGKCGRKFPNPFSGAEWVEIAYVELEKKYTPNHPPLHT